MATQLTLGISLGSDLNLDSFVEDNNRVLLAALRAMLADATGSDRFLYAWGDSGSGKTHLLHAIAKAAAENGLATGMLSGAEHSNVPVAMIEGWDALDLVLVDDLDAFAGHAAWEEALFHMYNRLNDRQARLLVASRHSPASSGVDLPDLQTRLSYMLVYQLQSLDDDGRQKALQAKARQRGLELPAEVARWLLTRHSRDMGELASLLDRLDAAAMQAKRRLTIPFVKDVIGAG
ncbi:MAG: DnaA regulatory inactivator Hda [Gammaproteobacteria bacterium]|nr:DnaA regulatory inactivator Hda [Gammaproteobacteria bacterium]